MDRRKSAKKAARTRAANRAEMAYIQEVIKPGIDRLQAILRELIARDPQTLGPIHLRWNPTRDTGHKLRHGATHGTLVGFKDARLLTVLPDGYKHPQHWHPAFWEFER